LVEPLKLPETPKRNHIGIQRGARDDWHPRSPGGKDARQNRDPAAASQRQLCKSWNEIDPSATIDQAVNGGLAEGPSGGMPHR
jgi:hypothetical protein